MSKLREKLENWYNSEPKNKEDEILVLEQITDDFSVKFAEWLLAYGYDGFKTIQELQQYFKQNIYGKE